MKKNKKSAYHIKHKYTRFESFDGYKFWAKNEKDAKSYCSMMNWKFKGTYEEKK